MTTVVVSSVAELRAALANPAVTVFHVNPGTYTVSNVVYVGGSGDGFAVTHHVSIEVNGAIGARANFVAGADFSKGMFRVAEGVSATFDGIGFYNLTFEDQAKADAEPRTPPMARSALWNRSPGCDRCSSKK